MSKAYALVLGIIFSITMLTIPFTGAFADSDPGLAGQVFNAAFSWYNGFPLVDSSGYIDINDWSITYRSNGSNSTSSAGPGDVVFLYQPGDYVEYTFQQYDLLSTYSTAVWCIQFGQNPYYSSGELDNLKYTLLQSAHYSDSFYKYIRGFSYDNRQIDWTHVFFSYPGTGVTKIRIEYDGTPAIWNCIYMKFLGYRNATDAITQADLYQLQAQITTSLNVARLADIVEIDSSDVDLSTLEATTASILQKLANVPDIIQYIDQIETIDTNILSAINTFYNYFYNLYNLNYSAPTFIIFDSLHNSVTGVFDFSNSYIDLSFPVNGNYVNDFLAFRLTLSKGSVINSVIGSLSYSQNFSVNTFNLYYEIYPISQDRQYLIIFVPCFYFTNYYSSNNYLNIRIYSDNASIVFNNNVTFAAQANKDFNRSWFDRIEVYIKQLLGINQTVPSDILQTTNEINQNAEAVNDFQSSTQQSLDNDLQNVPVAQYQIQATSGTQYMKAYSEALFNASNGFRIWYMLPLILFLIGMLIRWGIKK